MKKLILMLLASFVMTSSYAQFFKRKGISNAEMKPKREVKAKEPKMTKEEKKAARDAKMEERKAEKAAKNAEKEAKEESSLTPRKLNDKDKLNPPLQDVKWVLLDVSGKPLNNSGEIPYIIMYTKGNKLVGHTGCNSIGGKYDKGRHDDIKYEAITTKMACAGMDNERYMLEALSGANLYMLNGQNLLLYHDNLLLAIFEARFD